MDKNKLLDQPCTQGYIVPILGHAKNNTEFVPEIVKTLVASMQAIHLESSEQHLDPVGKECILIVFHQNSLEDFLIRSTDKCLEDEHDGNDVFLLSPAEPQHCIAI